MCMIQEMDQELNENIPHKTKVHPNLQSFNIINFLLLLSTCLIVLQLFPRMSLHSTRTKKKTAVLCSFKAVPTLGFSIRSKSTCLVH